MAATPARFGYDGRRGLSRAGWFALIWWIVTKGEAGSWVVGLPAVVAATMLSMMLLPAHTWHWRILGAIRLLGYFLWQSVMGGSTWPGARCIRACPCLLAYIRTRCVLGRDQH
jgi:multicomponent Na+:H+ antiporter subunit E